MGKSHHLVRSMSIYFGDFPDFLFKTTQIFRDFPLISQAFPPQGLPMDFPRDFRGFPHFLGSKVNELASDISVFEFDMTAAEAKKRGAMGGQAAWTSKIMGKIIGESSGKRWLMIFFFLIYGIIIYLWWLGLFICYSHDGLWWTLLDYSNILWLMMGKASYHVEHRW